MSIIETLTEGMVQRNMQQEGAALLNKWTNTGLLEGLSDDNQKASMARLLENQARELLRESNTMAGGNIEGFAAVAFPIVRRVFAGLIANDLVSVQPMSLPSGLIFFLDFKFGNELGGDEKEGARLGQNSDQSIYGQGVVGSEITGGVNLNSANMDSQPYGFGSAYTSATGSFSTTATAVTTDYDIKSLDSQAMNGLSAAILITATQNQTPQLMKQLEFDPDVLAETDDGVGSEPAVFLIIDLNRSVVEGTAGSKQINMDHLSQIHAPIETLGATNIGGQGVNTIDNWDSTNEVLTYKQVRRLTKYDAATDKFTFVYTAPQSSTNLAQVAPATITFAANALANSSSEDKIARASYPAKDTIGEKTGGVGSVIAGANWALEGAEEIPEIDIKVDSIAITAVTKKLKAKWTPELGQDLNAYHNLDAEVELTSILSEQIALELDREILSDLVNGATAGTFYWSRNPGMFVNRLTGQEVGASAVAPDFTGTVSEWYETLIETINDVSAQIHRKTLRGGANFCVVSPEVANVLEFTAGFRANVTADADKGDIGAVKVGSLNRKFDVIVDPYFPRNAILVGRKGSSFLESGYVYAPYVPLQTTPTIFGPEDFVPRKGVMTRYGKKMVRPDMYGLVIVRDLLGSDGTQ